MSDYDPDPRHIAEPEEERPLPWEDPFYDGNDGNDGAEEDWPPRRSAWPT